MKVFPNKSVFNFSFFTFPIQVNSAIIFSALYKLMPVDISMKREILLITMILTQCWFHSLSRAVFVIALRKKLSVQIWHFSITFLSVSPFLDCLDPRLRADDDCLSACVQKVIAFDTSFVLLSDQITLQLWHPLWSCTLGKWVAVPSFTSSLL